MYIDANSTDKIPNAKGELITQQTFALSWASAAGLPAKKHLFTSMLPDDQDLKGEEDSWFRGVARDILQNQQTQLMNMSTAVNQTFYNKMVSYSDTASAGIGTLGKFMPEIGNMAAGQISGEFMNIGGDILAGIGGDSENNGAASTAIAAVESTMNAAIGGLSAITAINPIVGAVVAAGFMIAKAAAAEGERRRLERVASDTKFYESLTGFPQFDKSGDEMAMDAVLGRMPTTDWTSLFLPRYKPGNEWVGVMRQTGVEFAPGNSGTPPGWGESVILDGAAFAVNKYNGALGLGLIPGTQQASGTLQSRLTPLQLSEAYSYLDAGGHGVINSVWEWAQLQGSTAVGEGAVDTGDYYPSSAQTMSFLWGHIQTQGAAGNPDLYKINCPVVDGQWGQYCDGAWDYVNEHCGWDTYNFDMKGHSMAKHIENAWQSQARRRRMVSQQSCAIACLLGVYRCHSKELGGGFLTGNPNYKQGPGSKACRTNLNSFPTDCRQNIHDAYIHDTVVELHKMQYEMLSASLVCAYVRADFAAFKGSANDGGQGANLMTKLTAMRTKLLNRPDQWKYLVEANVPQGEMHDGGDWYTQLKAAGAFSLSKGLAGVPGQSGSGLEYGQGGLSLQAGQGFEDPAPPVMQLVGRVPGQELVEEAASGRSSGGGKGIILLAAAALGFMAMRNKRR